jgi:hypothetical protein
MKDFYIHKKAITFVILILLFPIFQQVSANETVYKPGTKFAINVKWWGLSANGTIEMLEKTKIGGRDVVLVRSQSMEVAGLLGFVVKFLRIYKESNTFDSYIDLETFLPVRYEVYKLNKDGSKKVTEHILFDRKLAKVKSYSNNSTILSNVPSNIQDVFSGFLNLIYRFNTEDIFIGKSFDLNLYMYKELGYISAKVISQKIVNGQKIYAFKINRLPDVFKYPASLTFEVAIAKDGLNTFMGDLTKIK